MALRKVAYDEDWGTKEVADCIGATPSWVQRAALSGIIPSYRLSDRGRFHFRRAEIERWYASRLRGAALAVGGRS